jgi:hypothetical protein
MATSESIPTKASDLVLCKMQRKMFVRLVVMWRRADTGLDFYIWCAQKLENLAIDDFNAQKIVGLNREEKSTRAAFPISRGRGRPQLSVKERAEIKAAVIAGKIRNDSAAALLCASQEECDG